jgi:hypothetical protein
MSISAEKVGVHNGGMTRAGTMRKDSATGRGNVTPLGAARRKTEVSRAREARHGLKPRAERFAHLKRMYD